MNCSPQLEFPSHSSFLGLDDDTRILLHHLAHKQIVFWLTYTGPQSVYHGSATGRRQHAVLALDPHSELAMAQTNHCFIDFEKQSILVPSSHIHSNTLNLLRHMGFSAARRSKEEDIAHEEAF